MQYKRNESFRYEFPVPLEANCKLLRNGRIDSVGAPIYSCKILDISPHGMKMFSDVNFGEHTSMSLQLEIHFILDEMIITAVGNVMWKRPYANGFTYGLMFFNQPKLEQAIITDLKSRRRKEVALKK